MGRVLFLSLLLLQMTSSLNAALINTTQGSSAIYGLDERKFVDKNSSATINELSKSVALIVSRDALIKQFGRTFISAKSLTDLDGVNSCLTEKFATHHSLNSCTGFLNAPDLLLSAGHCFMSADDCANKKIIFNVRAEQEIETGYKVSNNLVYECSEILKNQFDAEATRDFAVIRLKEKVLDRRPLKLRSKGSLKLDDQVFMIGHPLGLPLISSGNTGITDISNPHFFKATLDSFEGNSGSPVFNSKTLEVEGILVRGEDDFVEDPVKGCYRNQVYELGTKGEGVSRISDVLPL